MLCWLSTLFVRLHWLSFLSTFPIFPIDFLKRDLAFGSESSPDHLWLRSTVRQSSYVGVRFGAFITSWKTDLRSLRAADGCVKSALWRMTSDKESILRRISEIEYEEIDGTSSCSNVQSIAAADRACVAAKKPLSLNFTKFIDPTTDEEWLQRVEAASEAIESGIQPQLIETGSSGSYLVFDKNGVSFGSENKRGGSSFRPV